MAVSVQHDGMTITSTADNADQVLASLQAADAASAEHKPTPPPTSEAAGTGSAETALEAVAPAADAATTGQSPAAEAPVEEPEPPQPRAQNGQFQSKHKKGSLQYRMDQKTWQAAEALRTLESERTERQRLQREIEDLRKATPQMPATKPPDPPDKPQLDQFQSYEEYVEAVADWKAEQKFKARDQQAGYSAFLAERAKLGETFQQRKAEFAKTVADFDEVVDTQDVELSAVMSEALVTSEHGPAIAYYLGKHPEEAFRLMQESQQTPVSAAPLMRRVLETSAQAFLRTLTAPSATVPAQTRAVVRQAAPAPIKPVGSGLSVADTAPDDLPFGKEYVDRMNAIELRKAQAKQGR